MEIFNDTEHQENSTIQVAWGSETITRLAIAVVGAIITLQSGTVVLLLTFTSAIRKKKFVFFILCLSVGDLLFGLSVVVTMTSLLFPEMITIGFCSFFNVLIHMSISISLVQSNTVCLERYLKAHCFPSKSMFFHKHRQYTWLIMTWSACTIFVIILITLVPKSHHGKKVKCAEVFEDDGKLFTMILNSIYFILFVTNIILFCLLSNEIRQKLRKITPHSVDEAATSQNRRSTWLSREITKKNSHAFTSVVPNTIPTSMLNSNDLQDPMKSIKTAYLSVCIIMSLFFSCFGPAIIKRQIDLFSTTPLRVSTNHMSLGLLGLNALLNPFLYVWRLEEFKQSLPWRRGTN